MDDNLVQVIEGVKGRVKLQVVKSVDKKASCCGECGGDGYVYAGNRVSPCASCQQKAVEYQNMKRFERLCQEGNMAPMKHMTFESYKPKTEKQKEVFEIMKAEHRGYYLFGPWGVGKTHLTTASSFRCLYQNIPAVIISVPKFLDVIRRQGRDKDYVDIEKQAYTIPYLVLDDIGKQKDSDWTDERLFMLLDERLKLYESGKCHTSFTSQFPLEELKKRIDGASVDRIKGMCRVLFVDGESMRGKNQQHFGGDFANPGLSHHTQKA